VNFLNIGPWEMMVILAIAILLIGPKRVMEIGRSIGRLTNQLRRMSGEFVGDLQTELEETEQEARGALKSIAEGGADVSAEIEDTGQEARQALEGIGESEAEAPVSVQSVQEELQSFGREARQIVEEVTGGFAEIVRGERESKEEQDGEASQEENEE
jgi:sec-independent protein translocase protein TatA